MRKKTRATEELIQAKTRELEFLQRVEGSTGLGAENDLKDEIHVLLEQEDMKWRQRAKEAWLEMEIAIQNIFMRLRINAQEEI